MGKYLNLETAMFDGVGKYDIPEIQPIARIPTNTNWIPFSTKQNSFSPEKTGVTLISNHSICESIWNRPIRYVDKLLRYNVVTSPEFGIYSDFPKAVNVFNHYRKHWLAVFLQECGVNIIPSIKWCDKDSFEWCFDGEPEGSLVVVSNLGYMKTKEKREVFKLGYNEMLTRLQPKEIILFAKIVDDYKGNVKVIQPVNYFEKIGLVQGSGVIK